MLGDIDRESKGTNSEPGLELEQARRRADRAERRIQAECASMVHEARLDANLTQSRLSKLVGTSQSAIARFEDPEYGVRKVAMMARIATVLGYEFAPAFIKVNPTAVCKAVIMASSPAANGDRGGPWSGK